MNFKTKIFLTTLTILISTLLLNSMMSIFSFEKSYVNSLISTYQIAGNSLKRKIEQSLLFGKPLDKFQGMELLFQKLGDQNKHLSQIWIEGKNGDTLYEFNKSKSKKKDNLSFKHPGLIENITTTTLLTHNHYLTVIPLQNASKQIVGRLYLSFPQKIIYEKTKEMIKSNLIILWPIVISTSFCLIFFLAILIFKPLIKEIADIIKILEKDNKTENSGNLLSKSQPIDEKNPKLNKAGRIVSIENEKVPKIHTAGIDLQKVKNEMDMLNLQIRKFIVDSNASIQRAGELKQEQQLVFDLSNSLKQCEIELEKEINHIKYDKNSEEKLMIQSIINENQYVREMISLINDIIRESDLIDLSL